MADTLHITCRKPTGVATYGREVYGEVCGRIRFHPGGCKAHTAFTQIRSYYDINRRMWPDMPRPRALYSAVRCWWMCRSKREPDR